MRPRSEKRDCARFYHEIPVAVEECGTGVHFAARIYNYSLHGMYFESDHPFLTGTRVNVWLSNLPESSYPVIDFAEVRWCQEITGAVVLYNYGAGIRYHQPIKYPEFPMHFQVIEGGAKNPGHHKK